jgi:hypothetical protein
MTFGFYLTSGLVHNLVHTGLDFGGSDCREGSPLHLRSNVTVALCHAYGCARRPPKDLSYDGDTS